MQSAIEKSVSTQSVMDTTISQDAATLCPVCGGPAWLCRYQIRDWSILECGHCRYAHIDPMPVRGSRPDFYSEKNVVTRITGKHRTGFRKFFSNAKKWSARLSRRDKHEIFFKKLTQHLPAGATILDVACGDGAFLRRAKTRFSATGIEISEYLGTLAAAQEDINIVIGDFLTAEFPAGSFDGVTMLSLLEHLDDPRGALEKCFHLLRDDGVLLLKTVNYACVNRVFRREDWTGFRPPDHMVYFTPKNLTRLLRNIGFTQVKCSGWPFNDNMYCDARK